LASRTTISLDAWIYQNIENKLKLLSISRRLFLEIFSIEEQNNWFSALIKPLPVFLSTEFYINTKVLIPFSYGQALQSGYVDTASLLIIEGIYKRMHYLLKSHFI
jgi:hypothetical protein